MILRSCFIRFVAFVVLLVPLTMLVSQVYQHTKSNRVFELVITLTVDHHSVSPAPLVVRDVVPVRKVSPLTLLSGTSVMGGPSLSPALINQVLASAGSPALGTGQALYDLSAKYHIDDAYALAVFEKESSFGRLGYGFYDHALGNIVCAGYPTCNGRFRSYSSWQVGYEDFYRLLTREYIPRGLTTVESITWVYAPSSENNTVLYIRQVCTFMQLFRRLVV